MGRVVMVGVVLLLGACGTGPNQPSATRVADPGTSTAPWATPEFSFSIARSLPDAPTSTPAELPHRAQMEAAVALAHADKLQPVEGWDLYKLPPHLAGLAIDDTVSVIRDPNGDGLTVIFYVILPGGPDHYSAFVYREAGQLTSDPNAGGEATISRLDDRWFWVVAY